MSLVVHDGPYAQSGGLRVGAPAFEFPFLQNGDTATLIVTRTYKQTRASYLTDRLSGTFKLGTVHDHEYTDAWLIAETAPSVTTSGLFVFQRRFARIPQQQTVPDSLFIPKPELTGEFPQPIGDFLVFKPDETKAIYDAYTVNTVSSDSGPVASIYPTGGTYTLTFGGDTTAGIAYNASAGTVQTALNALTSITDMGGVVVGGSYNSAGGLTVTFNSYSAVSMTSSLTLGSGTGYLYVTTANGGFTQSLIIQSTTFADITGGDFTLTIFGQTTGAIAYNATAADVQTALNALSEVSDRGNCTITLEAGKTTILAAASQIRFTINFTAAVLTASAASLTPVGSTVTPAITDGTVGRTQKITFVAGAAARTLYISGGHGIVAGDTIYIKGDSTYYSGITAFTITDSNTITLVGSDSATYNGATAITEVGKLTIDNYTPEPKQTRVKYVTDYYLPGVSPGITTADDIPLPTYQGDTTTLLAAIFAGDGEINYQVGGLKQWLGSPILERTTTKLTASQL
jgi:hypothetical protein